MEEIVMLRTMDVAIGLALVCWAVGGQAGDAAAGQGKAAMCFACHGASGVSTLPNYPNLAGQKEQYLIKQLTDFKAGKRTDPSMSSMVSALPEGDVPDIAAYFSSLPAGK